MHRRNMARIILSTLGFSLSGLGLCKLVPQNAAFSQSKIYGWLELAFSIGSCIGLLAWAILILVWKKPTRNEVLDAIRTGQIDPRTMSASQRTAMNANYGSLPKWIYLPFLSVALLLTALTVLSLIGMVIWMIFF